MFLSSYNILSKILVFDDKIIMNGHYFPICCSDACSDYIALNGMTCILNYNLSPANSR